MNKKIEPIEAIRAAREGKLLIIGKSLYSNTTWIEQLGRIGGTEHRPHETWCQENDFMDIQFIEECGTPIYLPSPEDLKRFPSYKPNHIPDSGKKVELPWETSAKAYIDHWGMEKALSAPLTAESELHPDSEHLLKTVFEELRLKMISNQKKYGWLNEWLLHEWEDECRAELLKHISKGDPRDVAIYAMFMIFRGWPTKAEPTQTYGEFMRSDPPIPDTGGKVEPTLPTDEEIEKAANKIYGDGPEFNQEIRKVNFATGAKWMRDKLKALDH